MTDKQDIITQIKTMITTRSYSPVSLTCPLTFDEKEFASYLGLVPTSHSSGEKVLHGEKTFRGNKQIGPMIIEAAWVAISRDAGLGSLYLRYKERMKPQEAIVRIARKLSNILFSILKNETEYVPYRMGK